MHYLGDKENATIAIESIHENGHPKIFISSNISYPGKLGKKEEQKLVSNAEFILVAANSHYHLTNGLNRIIEAKDRHVELAKQTLTDANLDTLIQETQQHV